MRLGRIAVSVTLDKAHTHAWAAATKTRDEPIILQLADVLLHSEKIPWPTVSIDPHKWSMRFGVHGPYVTISRTGAIRITALATFTELPYALYATAALVRFITTSTATVDTPSFPHLLQLHQQQRQWQQPTPSPPMSLIDDTGNGIRDLIDVIHDIKHTHDAERALWIEWWTECISNTQQSTTITFTGQASPPVCQAQCQLQLYNRREIKLEELHNRINSHSANSAYYEPEIQPRLTIEWKDMLGFDTSITRQGFYTSPPYSLTSILLADLLLTVIDGVLWTPPE